MLHILMAMSHDKAFTFPTAGSATNTAFLILILLRWARPFAFVSRLLKLDAWVSEGIVNIIVSKFRNYQGVMI